MTLGLVCKRTRGCLKSSKEIRFWDIKEGTQIVMAWERRYGTVCLGGPGEGGSEEEMELLQMIEGPFYHLINYPVEGGVEKYKRRVREKLMVGGGMCYLSLQLGKI